LESVSTGNATPQVAGRSDTRVKSVFAGMRLSMSPFMAWQRQTAAPSTSDSRPLQQALEGAGTLASVKKSLHGVILMNHDTHDAVACSGGLASGDGAGDGVPQQPGSALAACEGCGVVATTSAKARKRLATSLDDAMAAARVWAMGVWPACAGVFIYITKHLARVACPIMATTKIY